MLTERVLICSSEYESGSSNAAKLQIYLLGHHSEGSLDRSLGHLITLSNLLEQYFHPSNTGSWTTNLTGFLRNLVTNLSRRLIRELGPSSAAGKEGPPIGVPVTSPRRALTTDSRRVIVDVVLKLASKAMYSKDSSLKSNAGQALATIAYLEPKVVLRLIVDRFQVCFTCLSIVVRHSDAVLQQCSIPCILGYLSHYLTEVAQVRCAVSFKPHFFL